MTLQRIKRITSHSGHARFLAECEEHPAGEIHCQPDIPSPYAYSSTWTVYERMGRLVLIRETAHKQYDVFEVPRSLLLPQSACPHCGRPEDNRHALGTRGFACDARPARN